MSFPKIKHLNDLLPYIADNPQFRVQEQPNGTTVVCYMLQDEDTFRGEHEEFYKECRGITFDTETGNIVSRTLHKFKNIGESEDTQPNLIPWDKIDRVMDKRDGSMITFVELKDGMIVGKTKKTFTSAEAIAATEFINRDAALNPRNTPMISWIRKWVSNGYTPTFEWTSPKFPIVLLYEKDELTLLQIRENSTGEYMDLTKGPQFGVDDYELMPFPIVQNEIDKYSTDGVVDYEKIRYMQLTREGIEGIIVQTADGEMWKAKTKWYCDLHHSVTFTRWRDVARTVLDDKSDDLKAAFAITGRDIQPIVEVENKIFAEIERVTNYCEQMAGNGKLLNRTAKDMALAHKDNEHFKYIMRTFHGQDINWLEWYLKKHIDSWSLEVIPTISPNEDNDVLPD